MTSIQHQIEINWPINALFNYVSDLSNNPAWQRQITHAEWVSSERNKPGSSFLQTRRVMGRNSMALMQVTDFQRFEKREWIVSDPVKQLHRLEFESRGEQTLMKLTIAIEPSGQESFERAFMKNAIREGYDNLRRLKEILENYD